MIHIEPRDGLYRITFPYNPTLVEAVKKIPGRKWDKEARVWTVPQCLTTRSFIKHFLPDVIFPDVQPPQKAPEYCYQPTIEGYRHQKDISLTVMDAVSNGRSIALFAETGTGKTKAVLDALSSLSRTGKKLLVLVVCPRPLIGVWKAEASRWGSHCPPVVCHGPNRLDPRELGRDSWLVITSYGTLVNDLDKWVDVDPDLIVFDEAHLLKNKSSQRSKACRKLRAWSKLPMTGTPYGNEYKDLWAIMDTASPEALGPWGVFASAYCEYGGWEGKEIIGYKNVDLMMKIIQHSAIVVRKQECLDIPDKIYQVVNLSMGEEQRRVYRRCESGGVGDMPITSILAMISKLRQISSGFVYGEDGEIMDRWASAKIEALQEMCWDTPTVIWHNFTEEGDMIEKCLSELGVRTVRAKGDGKAYAASQIFEQGHANVIVAQMQTLQYGVTMNRATRSIYFSGTFSSLDRSQSEDRNHRIGQHNSVLYIDFISSPVEQWIYDACMQKIDVREHVLLKLKELQNCP